MSMVCQSCFYDNPAGCRFCLRCGKALFSGGTQQLAGSQQLGVDARQPAFATFQSSQMSGQIPQQMRTPPVSPAYQEAGGLPSSGVGSLRRAFAGHGALITHHSWLIPGKQAEIMTVRQTIFDKITQRGVDGLKINRENLTDQGVVDEHRDYITTRRKSTSVFVYATPAGPDLYLSRATTVLPKVSLARVILLILGIVGIITPIIGIVGSVASASASAAYTSAYGGGASSGAFPLGLVFWIILLLFFSFPLLWLFVIALARSLASLMLDKDFLVLLRPNRLTEFQRDEIALLEHMIDGVLQEAMKQLGLNADKITPPPGGYQPKERFRLI